MNILERISEQDIHDWMKAKIAEVRSGQLPGLHYFHFDVSQYEGQPYINVGAQASGECVVSENNFPTAITNLKKLVLKDPAARASEKRRSAQGLLKEAEELEAAAKTIETQTPQPEVKQESTI